MWKSVRQWCGLTRSRKCTLGVTTGFIMSEVATAVFPPKSAERVHQAVSQYANAEYAETLWQSRRGLLPSLPPSLHHHHPAPSCLCCFLPEESDAMCGTAMACRFTLCPAGHNPESYRIYEALMVASIPIIHDTYHHIWTHNPRFYSRPY